MKLADKAVDEEQHVLEPSMKMNNLTRSSVDCLRPPSIEISSASTSLIRGRSRVNGLLMLVLFVAAGMAYGQNSETEQLDQLLAENRVIDLARVLQTSSINPQQKLEWLKRRAAEGYVIAQYELANQLSKQSPVEAINWYAKARLGRILDAAECKDVRRAEGIGVLIDVGYQALQEFATKNEGLFASAIERALDDEHAQTARVPPYWICAPGNSRADESSLLAAEQRRKKRQEARSLLVTRGQLRALETRLNANLNPERFEISPIPARLWGDEVANSISWVDNNVVLLSAYDKPSTRQRNLYSWDVEKGHVRLVAQNAGGPCAFKGFISYVVIKNGVWYRREGRFGEEVETVEPRPFYPDYVVFRCRVLRRADWSKHPAERPLEAGGVLKFPSEAERRRVPMRFYPEGSKVATDLPFVRGEMLTAQSAQYSEYLQASWIIRHKTWMGPQDHGRVWVLHPDGRVDTIDIPPGPWVSRLGNYPIKGGWLLSNHSGVYVWFGGEVHKVLNGVADDAAVSPNGCRSAVKIGPPGAVANLDHGFKVVDVCKRTSMQ